jgi:hypothetical protein
MLNNLIVRAVITTLLTLAVAYLLSKNISTDIPCTIAETLELKVKGC